MKIGIIRCQKTEDLCAGFNDFKCAAAGSAGFETLAPVEIVGFVSCGGCPGKAAVARAEMMVRKGAEAIALASCIGRGAPYQWPCPNFDAMLRAVRRRVGESIKVLEWTH